MTKIVMPNFDEWATSFTWSPEPDGLSVEQRFAIALRQAFDQGRALGAREALCSNQEWWKDEDEDEAWLQSHGETPTEE